MGTLSHEEVRKRLAEIPVERFGDRFQNNVIGLLHWILTDETVHSCYGNVYHTDVTLVVTALNNKLSPEDRKALAMMLPLPEAFPVLTPAHALKLALWAGEQALSHYTGSGREVLEQAVALAHRGAAGEPFTEEEASAIVSAALTTKHNAEFTEQRWPAHILFCIVLALVSSVRFHSSEDASATVASTIRIAIHADTDWREWMEEYLRIRLEA